MDKEYKSRKYQIIEIEKNKWQWQFYKEDGKTIERQDIFIGTHEFIDNIVCRAIDRVLDKKFS